MLLKFIIVPLANAKKDKSCSSQPTSIICLLPQQNLLQIINKNFMIRLANKVIILLTSAIIQVTIVIIHIVSLVNLLNTSVLIPKNVLLVMEQSIKQLWYAFLKRLILQILLTLQTLSFHKEKN